MRVSIILIIFSVLLISSIALVNAEVDWEKKYKFLFKKLIDSRLQVAELKGEIIELQNALRDRPVIEPVIIENKTESILNSYADYKKNPSIRDAGRPTETIIVDIPQLRNIQLDNILDIRGLVKDAWDIRNEKEIDYDINLEISRRNFVLFSQSQTLPMGSQFHFEIFDVIFPIYYHKLCYDVKYTVNYDNKTEIRTDDFLILDFENYTSYDFSVFDTVRYDYLPADFRLDPRPSYFADEKCN